MTVNRQNKKHSQIFYAFQDLFVDLLIIPCPPRIFYVMAAEHPDFIVIVVYYFINIMSITIIHDVDLVEIVIIALLYPSGTMPGERDAVILKTSFCGRIHVVPLFLIGNAPGFTIDLGSEISTYIFRHHTPADVAVADEKYLSHSIL